MSGIFYIVPTPIGNLGDITIRAVEILKSVDYIACEDTRVTKILAEKYGFSAILFDCHKFNEKERSKKIISLLNEGKNIALVSDAGTPGISDPGGNVITELLKNGIKITSLPGACAVSTFLSRIPRKCEEFAFIGFIPKQKNAQKEILEKHKYTNCVFYDSPNRLKETLENISEFFDEERLIAVGRELTKIYEEVQIGSIKEIMEYYDKNPLKGEIVAMIFASEKEGFDNEELKNKVDILKREGFGAKDITKILTKLFGLNKNEVYKFTLKNYDEKGTGTSR